MTEHDYDVSCECGAQWRVRLEYDDDAMASCLACGADTFDLIDLGEVQSAGPMSNGGLARQGFGQLGGEPVRSQARGFAIDELPLCNDAIVLRY